MDFGEILSKAWKITWKFKVLWIFGILASCGTGGRANFNYQSSARDFRNGSNLPPALQSAILQFVHWFSNPAVIVVFVSVICILVILSIFLGTIGRIGLIKGAAEADAGAEHLTFGGLWKASTPYFWRMFGLSILIGLPFFVIALIIGLGVVVALLPLMGMNNNPSGSGAFLVLLPVLCLLFCVIFILSIIVSFISTQAYNAIVIENETIIGSLKRGWEILTKNLGPILIVWIIMLVIGLVAGIVIALPILIIVLPVILSMMNSTGTFSTTPLIVAGLCFVAYLPVSLVANGILQAYVHAVWTLTYLRLTKPKQEEPAPIALPTNA